jgi:hypothetical protein
LLLGVDPLLVCPLGVDRVPRTKDLIEEAPLDLLIARHPYAGVGSISREAGNRITQTSARTEGTLIDGMKRDVSEGMRTAFEGYRRLQYLDERVRS